MVDDEDLEILRKKSWSVTRIKRGTTYGYPRCRLDGKTVSMHRLIMNAQSGEIVDHINGENCDNRKSNLRFVTKQQNNENRQHMNCNNTSGHRGVSFNGKAQKWMAYYCRNNHLYYLGYFDTREEAALVSSQARRENMIFSEMDKFGAYCVFPRELGACQPVVENQQMAA